MRCQRFLCFLATLSLTLPFVSIVRAAGDPERRESRKPAWSWTLDERLAARFDPAATEARATERANELRAFRGKWSRAGTDDLFGENFGAAREAPVVDVVDGRKTPELILPSELFDHLLSIGFPPPGESAPPLLRAIEERATALGFGRDLWGRLAKVTAPYLALQRERDRLARARSGQPNPGETGQMTKEDLSWCRTRAVALAAARAEFGDAQFGRLLYLAVAPPMNLTYIVTKGFPEHSRFLRFLEGGCR